MKPEDKEDDVFVSDFMGIIASILFLLVITFFYFLYSGEWETLCIHHLLSLFNLNIEKADFMTPHSHFTEFIFYLLDFPLWGFIVFWILAWWLKVAFSGIIRDFLK